MDLEVETDCSGAASAIHANLDRLPEMCRGVVEDIRQLKSSFYRISISWRPREANRAADAMARLGQNMQEPGVHVIDDPPSEIGAILSEDMRGLRIPRS